MKRHFKILISSLLLGSIMLVGQSCEKWLDVKDYDKIPYDEFWQTQEHVYGGVMGAYIGFRDAAPTLFYWGELRGDKVERNISWTGDQANDARDIKQLEIRPENSFAKYVNLYKVINRCNLVIQNAHGVLDLDDTFTLKQCNEWVAEMKFLRSLCYFYLVRAFRDVPYVTYGYMDDLQPFAVAKTDGYEILDKLEAELLELVKPGEGHLLPVRQDEPLLGKGRATAYAAFALLADIYLWQEKYDEALTYCQKILNNEIVEPGGDGLFALIQTVTERDITGLPTKFDNNAWYNKLFGTGNSTESIFEVQWAGTQVNGVLEILYHKDGKGKSKLLIPTRYADAAKGLYGTDMGQTRNVRGQGRSIGSDARIWKYSSKTAGGNGRADSERSVNFIVYRLTEIYLMQAEALIMKGEFQKAYDIINMIRERGGFDAPHPIQFANEKEGLEYLLLEKEREFFAEGKRWFDLVRIALKKDGIGREKYKDLLIELLVADIPANDRDLYRGKLQEPYGYFLPIHQDEIDSSGGVVKQNKYYLNN